MTMRNQIIIGLIPSHNSENTITDVVNVLKKNCDEVVVVDNASTDLTAIRAINAGAIVITENSIGKGNALQRGFRECLNYPLCGAIVTLDADGENDPSDVLCLLTPILNHEVHVVFGVRTRTHSHLIFGHGTTGELLTSISGFKLLDPMSGVRAYSRESIMQLLPTMSRSGFGIDLQIAIEVIRLGIKRCEVWVSGNNLRTKRGWSFNHVSSALENLIDYEIKGLFPQGSVSNVVSWPEPYGNQLVLKTSKWEYNFRREGDIFIPEY